MNLHYVCWLENLSGASTALVPQFVDFFRGDYSFCLTRSSPKWWSTTTICHCASQLLTNKAWLCYHRTSFAWPISMANLFGILLNPPPLNQLFKIMSAFVVASSGCWGNRSTRWSRQIRVVDWTQRGAETSEDGLGSTFSTVPDNHHSGCHLPIHRIHLLPLYAMSTTWWLRKGTELFSFSSAMQVQHQPFYGALKPNKFSMCVAVHQETLQSLCEYSSCEWRRT